jgi:hypothetical protein
MRLCYEPLIELRVIVESTEYLRSKPQHATMTKPLPRLSFPLSRQSKEQTAAADVSQGSALNRVLAMMNIVMYFVWFCL